MRSEPNRNKYAALAAVLAMLLMAAATARPAAAQDDAAPAQPAEIVATWYRVVLNLVRHTPTYSPPVASRSFAYLGIVAWESVAGIDPQLVSLAGQVNGLAAPPAADPGATYEQSVVLHAALADSVEHFFANTGPTGQRVVRAAREKLLARASAGVDPAVVEASVAHGEAIAAHIVAWAATDGGAEVANMGFPHSWRPAPGPAHWVPTSTIAQQQTPLLPQWGANRPFAMEHGGACPLPPPPAYSEAEGSDFHREAMEVYRTGREMTPEQREIARFWSDDPMLSSTPPGHWLSIALQLAEREQLPADRLAELLARLGVATADAFIGCWHSKFEFDLVRPVTYIRRVIDPAWEPLLITPPFPEYPSGHSTLSSAAAEVMTAFFGEGYAFEDATHGRDGLPARRYADFRAAAREAALSRLYGGIHFRAAIERGLEQGRCVALGAVALDMRKDG